MKKRKTPSLAKLLRHPLCLNTPDYDNRLEELAEAENNRSLTVKDLRELVNQEQIPLNANITYTIFGGQADLYLCSISSDGPNLNLYDGRTGSRHLTIEDILNCPEDRTLLIPSMDDDFNEIMEPATHMEFIPDSNSINLYIQ